MKKVLRVLFILILMMSALLTMVILRWREKGREKKPVQTVATVREDIPSDTGGKTLAIADGDFAMLTGQSHQCSALLDGGTPAGDVIWSSTDERVVTIDSAGRISAVGAGEAEIIAVTPRGLKARVGISVYEDFAGAAAEAVSALADDGSVASMSRVTRMAARTGNSKSPGAESVHALLSAVASFANAGAGGREDGPALWDNLLSSAQAAGIDLSQNTLRKAALVAYCHGEKAASEATISFTGDCTFAYFNEKTNAAQFSSVYRNAGSVTYPFDLTKQIFAADDVTMINFEGTLTDYSKHKDKQFFFRGEPSYVNILTGSSVEAVTLENNHSFDYYETGFNDTVETLRNAGVRYTYYYSPAVMNAGSIRIVMLSLSMLNTAYTDEFREHIGNLISQYRAKDTVIVMNVHWGVELEDTPLLSQREAAREMINAGADLIVGHHPHLLQGVECYNGHYIFYSLGNFSFGGNTETKNPQTIILRAMVGRNESGRAVFTRVSVVPCLTTSTGSSRNNYRPIPLYGAQGQAVTDRLIRLSARLDDGVDRLTWHRIP